jgi:hypothetical protein
MTMMMYDGNFLTLNADGGLLTTTTVTLLLFGCFLCVFR